MKRFILIAITILCSYSLNAQNRNAVWCFGDSAGIDFSTPFPSTFQSGLDVRGSCTSIADTSGNLLFYASTSYKPYYWLGVVPLGAIYSKAHTLMQNGDSLIGRGWYNEIIIVPFPDSTNQYYVFHLGVTSIYGFYYSIVDISQNGGLGVVTQKNVQLQTFRTADCVSAIKHGNGRDWWVIFKNIDVLPNNDFYEYLITPSGISNVQIISEGTLNIAGFESFCVNSQGTKLAFVNAAGLVEAYDFNRCDGTISNARTIEAQSSSPPYVSNWECAFSPNSNLLYVTTNDSECVLLQYNLLDSNPSTTRDTLWQTTFPLGAIGAVRRAPNNKLYVSSAYWNGSTWNYPYPDSMYNVYNMNLSVINQPDSLGAACDFQPYSFYLGGKRTYWGLPNNPDYDMPRDSGSVCDTIQWTGIKEQELTGKGQLYVSYISAWQKAFINAQHLKGKTYMITVTDMMGRMVYKSSSGSASTSLSMTHSGYFTMDLDCSSFSNGMYVVTLITDKEMISEKFIRD